MSFSPSPPATSATPAVIFDLDGTLVDSEPNYYEAGRIVLAEYGVHAFTWEDHARFIGVSTRETLTLLREEHGLTASVEELLAAKNRAYLKLARNATAAFPEMCRLVERLHASGHPLAVASGSSRPSIEAVLTSSGLAGLLPRYVSAEDVGRGKPEPDVFLAAARMLGTEPEGCVVLEDAPPGAEAARRAGMPCIAVPYLPGTRDDPAFASAGLLFPEGPHSFDARRAYDWIRSHRQSVE